MTLALVLVVVLPLALVGGMRRRVAQRVPTGPPSAPAAGRERRSGPGRFRGSLGGM